MSTLRPLWLDYQRPLPGRQWPGLLLLATSLLLCGGLLAESYSLSSESEATQQQVFKLKRESERRSLLTRAEQPFAGTAREETDEKSRTLPPSAARWESLLGALEKAGDDSVTLLTLEPNPREIIIFGEAVDIGASLDYAKRLQSAPVLASVYLVKHETLREHQHRPVRFTLLAKWREA